VAAASSDGSPTGRGPDVGLQREKKPEMREYRIFDLDSVFIYFIYLLIENASLGQIIQCSDHSPLLQMPSIILFIALIIYSYKL